MNSLVNCLHPFKRKDAQGYVQLLPCHDCELCRSRKRAEWSQRLQEESKRHKYKFFVSLTYNDLFVPKYTKVYGDLVDLSTGEILDDFDTWFNLELDKLKFKNPEKYEKEKRYYECYQTFCFSRFSDIQQMVKRVRTWLKRDGYNNKVRYFFCSEIGPNTHRIHYHGEMWVDDDKTANVLETYIRKGWSHNAGSRKQPVYIPLCDSEQLKFEVDRGKASNYTSKYVTKDSSLPLVYRHRSIRTSFIFSKSPTIGLSLFKGINDNDIFFGKLDKISSYDPVKKEVFNISLFRSIKNRFFGKCLGYDLFSTSSRIRMYEYIKLGIFKNGCEELDEVSLFNLNWQDWLVYFCKTFQLHQVGNKLYMPKNYHYRFFHLRYFKVKYKDGYFISTDQVRKCWYVSRNFYRLKFRFNMTSLELVQHFEEYYTKQDYENLKTQLSFEQQFIQDKKTLAESIFLYPDFLYLLGNNVLDDYNNSRDILLSEYFGLDYDNVISHYNLIVSRSVLFGMVTKPIGKSFCKISNSDAYDVSSVKQKIFDVRKHMESDNNKRFRYEDFEYKMIPYKYRNYRIY